MNDHSFLLIKSLNADKLLNADIPFIISLSSHRIYEEALVLLALNL